MNSQIRKVSLGVLIYYDFFKNSFYMGDTADVNNILYIYLGVVKSNGNDKIWMKAYKMKKVFSIIWNVNLKNKIYSWQYICV